MQYSYLLTDVPSRPPKRSQSAVNDVEGIGDHRLHYVWILAWHILMHHNHSALTSFHRPCVKISRCLLLHCLRTICVILAGLHSYFVVPSFKCEGKNSCCVLIPKSRNILGTLILIKAAKGRYVVEVMKINLTKVIKISDCNISVMRQNW